MSAVVLHSLSVVGPDKLVVWGGSLAGSTAGSQEVVNKSVLVVVAHSIATLFAVVSSTTLFSGCK